MKSPVMKIYGVLCRELLKRTILVTTGIILLFWIVFNFVYNHQPMPSEYFAWVCLYMVALWTFPVIVTVLKNRFGFGQSSFPLQLFSLPLSNLCIGSVFFWSVLSILSFNLFLFSGFCYCLGVKCTSIDGIITLLCFISLGVSFLLSMPFVMLSIVSIISLVLVGIFTTIFWKIDHKLVMLGYVGWVNILCVWSAYYQRHRYSLKKMVAGTIPSKKTIVVTATTLIYPRVSKKSFLKALSWMETVRYMQYVWVLLSWIILLSILDLVSMDYSSMLIKIVGWVLLCFILKKMGHSKDSRRKEHTARLILPMSDYEIGVAESFGLYKAIGILCIVGLVLFDRSALIGLFRTIYQGIILGERDSLSWFSGLSITTCFIFIIFLASIFSELVKQYRLHKFWNIVISTALALGIMVIVVSPIMIVSLMYGYGKQEHGMSMKILCALFSIYTLMLLLSFGTYLWSLLECWYLKIINRHQLIKTTGVFTIGLLIGLVYLGLLRNLSYLMASYIFVELSLILLPMQLFPIIVHKQRHQ